MTDGGVPVDAGAWIPAPDYATAQPTFDRRRFGGTHAAVGRQEMMHRVPAERWPLLADDLFWIMHHDGYNAGSLRIAGAIAAMGLAGALLAELAWCRRIGLSRDGIVVVADSTAPPDVAAHEVLVEIGTEPGQHPVSTWVKYLSRTSYGLVSRRMVQHGLLRAQTSRRRLRPVTRFVPIDGNVAAWPATRLITGYQRGNLSNFDAVLTGLVRAVGLAQFVFYDLSAQELKELPQLSELVGPPLADVGRLVHATIGNAVITAR